MLKLVFAFLTSQVLAHPHDEFGELRVICVGCSSGIGRATAELLLEGGAQVVITSRSPDKAKDIVQKFSTAARLIAADASDPVQLKKMANEAKTFFGQAVTTLIWAPTAVALGSLRIVGGESSVAGIKEQMNVNVYGLVALVDALKNDLTSVAQTTPGSASVLSVSSMASVHPLHGTLAYGIAKAAQDAAMRGLALEFGALGVRFNSVLPAVIETPIFDNIPAELTARLLQDAAHRHVLGRNGQPAECAHMMAFLVSQKASFITGQAIHIDGGAGLLGSHSDWWSEVLTDTKDDRFFGIARKWSLLKNQLKKEL